MIIEQATVSIHPERVEAFADVFDHAASLLLKAVGCRSATLLRNVEDRTVFQIVVTWETLEDHTVRFREAAVFVEWRDVVGGFFAEPPTVLHYTVS